MTAVAEPAARIRRMTLWRLEWLRLTRTPRAVALGAVYVLLGLIQPVFTKYENKLLGHAGNGVRIYLPPPTPADGLNGYISEASLIGLIVVVVIAAGALSFDSRQGLATFLRTRVANISKLVAPRFAVSAAAAVAGYLLGTLAAWYETDLLIGSLPVSGMLAGILCGAAYLVFAVSLTTLAASLARSTLAIAGITLAVLLVLPIASTFHTIHDWFPSTLVNAPVDLVSGAHQLPHYIPALAVTAGGSVVALAIAVSRLRTREI
jgi:ABC-2 type transport system permease protein